MPKELGMRCFETPWGGNTAIYSVLEEVAKPIVKAWVKNTVMNSVLEEVAWQENFYNCNSIVRKHCNLQSFGASCFEPLLLHG